MNRRMNIAVLTGIFMCLLLVSCLREDTGSRCGNACPYTGARLFVVTSDFSVGSTAVISGAPPSVSCIPCLWVGSDVAARVFGNMVYIINRFGADNIQTVDAANGYLTLQQFSVGNGSNPQDIAVIGGSKAFVSRLSNASIWIGNPFTGGQNAAIDLSAYADPDGIPEAAKMTVVNNRLFVALQRLDSANWYVPTDKSSIAVINTDTNAVVAVIDLATKNPVTNLIYDAADGIIYVGCSGAWQSFGYTTPDGGVETITVDTATDTYTPNGTVIDEATLGGDVAALAVVSSTQAYALVSSATFTNSLVRFNPTTGLVDATLFTTSSYVPDIALDSGGYLYLADRTRSNPGVRVWDTATDAPVGGVISTGLPPYGLAVFP